ncbi:MAG: lecithin retinol acyltransferase family protein [Cyanobacteria bacterium P01_G01_bin.54]
MARGDQIYVIRKWHHWDGVYEHHGIDCGDGTVIHYRKPSETIERTSLRVFSQGKRHRRRNRPTPFRPEVIVQRALSRLGEHKYHLLSNNCEHFATWCRTGQAESYQIRHLLPWLANPAAAPLEPPYAQAKTAHQSRRLRDRALGDIKTIWDEIQPRYVAAQQDAQSWHKVAQIAIQGNREDLARAALLRKQTQQQKAAQLATQLQKLATMTETLLRNSLPLHQS